MLMASFWLGKIRSELGCVRSTLAALEFSGGYVRMVVATAGGASAAALLLTLSSMSSLNETPLDDDVTVLLLLVVSSPAAVPVGADGTISMVSTLAGSVSPPTAPPDTGRMRR